MPSAAVVIGTLRVKISNIVHAKALPFFAKVSLIFTAKNISTLDFVLTRRLK